VVFVVVVTAMEIFSVGFSAMARDSFTALRMGTHTSAVALGSLALLAFFYPVVDARTWQTLAAAAKDTQADPALRSATLQRIFHSVAIEVPLVWLLMCMFGTVAVVITETSAGGDAFSTFISWLAAEQGGPADFVLSFLLVGMFAMVLAAMSSMLSAMLWVVRYDMVPALWPDLACQGSDARDESMARRRTLLIGIGLCVLTVLLACLANAFLDIGFTSGNFLIVLIACCCAQLSLAPLLLPAIFGAPAAKHTQLGSLSGPWALIILGVGAATGIAAVAVYGASGAEPWLWAAIPACLASGTVLLGLARVCRPSWRQESVS
jgi:hypothetical protein